MTTELKKHLLWWCENRTFKDSSYSDSTTERYLKSLGLEETRCDCKKSFLQSQTSDFRHQRSVKTKSYVDYLFLNYSFLDFLQAHQTRHHLEVEDLCKRGQGAKVIEIKDHLEQSSQVA